MNRTIAPAAILAALIVTGSAAQAPTQPAPVPHNVRDAKAVLAAAPKVRISNGKLTVVLLPPDLAKGFYRGTRFDWGGIISSVTLAGHEFYGLWFDKTGDDIRDFVYDGEALIAGPNTAVMGPAEAFDSSNPPGWADAAPGEGFLKIGVGVLRKPQDGIPYSSFRLYDFIERGSWEVAHGKDWVSFTHRLHDDATGFGYVYVKTIRLAADAPELVIEHSLENTGRKPITTAMFNHNFLTFGGAPTTKLPTVTAPYPIESAAPPRGDAAALIDGRIQYRRALVGEEIFSLGIKGYQDVGDARFTITSAAGAAVSVASDRPWSRLMLWSIQRTVAMEPYVTLSVEPAQSTRWASRYHFTAPS